MNFRKITIFTLLLAVSACTPQPSGEEIVGLNADEQNSREAARSDKSRKSVVKEPKLSEAEISALPRDERRTKYLEGFSCDWMYKGQPAYIRYSSGGIVAVGHHEGEATSRWKIKSDEICFVSERGKKSCHNLPKHDLAGGKDEFLSNFRKRGF